ncbi:hypothetical protein CkaCkLH20_09534 [Colletotrichum karsti]|uniref:2EXR domain-containing protein n=1 Tax=Colletotrichum karsti TaxID=1095194 RepID=A0A9P6HZ03_9PEZI|nr:uncharacterized protein CkaCkLH20_09534 [Colletotrichum karsti]KAF9873024.1 hypothetical protein CkaCkLH20_09534 [Colletotrichum karsti]
MCTSFPQFPRLPRELQLLVWEAAAASSMEQQVIEGRVESETRKPDIYVTFLLSRLSRMSRSIMPTSIVFPFALTDVAPPVILSVCQTSRQIALRHKSFTKLPLTGDNDDERLVWFDFTSDIVFIPSMRSTAYGVLIDLARISNKETRELIQHMAAPWALFHTGNRCFQTELERRQWWITMLSQLYDMFPRLTDLYLCISAAKQNNLPDRGAHFLEDRRGPEKQRPVLEPIPGPLDQVQLPPCHCKVKPGNLGDTIDEVEKSLRSDWLRSQLQRVFDGRHHGGAKVPAPFRVHGRRLRLERIDLDT